MHFNIMAKERYDWLKLHFNIMPSGWWLDVLAGEIDTLYEKTRTLWTLDNEKYFGANFQPKRHEIHVLVELRTDQISAKRQRVESSTSLAELWELSELQLEALPAPLELSELLLKPLPFRLTLRDAVTAAGVFNPDGPFLSCPDLKLLMEISHTSWATLPPGMIYNWWQSKGLTDHAEQQIYSASPFLRIKQTR